MAAMVVLGALTVDRDASSVALLRRYVGGALELEGVDAGDVQLIVSELATNAVAYGGGARMGLLLTGDEERVRVEVTDGGGGEPGVREPSAEDEGGRGLVIVAAVAERWGVWREEGGDTRLGRGRSQQLPVTDGSRMFGLIPPDGFSGRRRLLG